MYPDESLPILATALIPWTRDFEFDEAAFRRQVGELASVLTRNIYIFGTAGEGYAVSDRLFSSIASCFLDSATKHRVRPMLGVVSMSLRTVIERIEVGAGMGYRDFQISLPSWGTLTDRELDSFFSETCGRFPHYRFLHYNLARAGRLLGPAEYRRISDRHGNLAAIKTSTTDPDVIAGLLALAPKVRLFITEPGYVVARKIAACGLLISLAGIHPARAAEFVTGGDVQRDALGADLKEILQTLIGIAADRLHMDGAFDKLLLRMRDSGFPLRLLPPYTSPTEDDAARLRSALPARWRLDA